MDVYQFHTDVRDAQNFFAQELAYCQTSADKYADICHNFILMSTTGRVDTAYRMFKYWCWRIEALLALPVTEPQRDLVDRVLTHTRATNASLRDAMSSSGLGYMYGLGMDSTRVPGLGRWV